MRIIAGEMRSRRLKTLEGLDTRPTGEKAREALFSILMARVPGARVLDLYAGSGALSLEAISRGAEFAVMADLSPKACRVIQENIADLKCEKRTRLIKGADVSVLSMLEKEKAQFDLILLDPPYRMDAAPVCEKIMAGKLLAEGGMIVVEHAKETPPDVKAPLVLKDRREYGAAGFSFYCEMGEDEV